MVFKYTFLRFMTPSCLGLGISSDSDCKFILYTFRCLYCKLGAEVFCPEKTSNRNLQYVLTRSGNAFYSRETMFNCENASNVFRRHYAGISKSNNHMVIATLSFSKTFIFKMKTLIRRFQIPPVGREFTKVSVFVMD